MTPQSKLHESQLAPPVLGLFSSLNYLHVEEFPLGRKKIDLVFLNRDTTHTVAVELKISDWKGALWQAIVNTQACDDSYVAIWHAFAHRPLRHQTVFEQYRVGLIVVTSNTADIEIKPSSAIPRTIPRGDKPLWYKSLLARVATGEA